jgi:hypothetical protein
MIFRSLILMLLTPSCVFAQIKLEKKDFIGNKIELLVPADFKSMSAEALGKKYPNRNHTPDVVLTDENGEVNIVMSLINQPLQDSLVGAYKDFQISSLKKLHPDAKWFDEGVKPINGKSVGYFKFTCSVVDDIAFNYYFFTAMDGKVMILSFNCTEKLLPKWKETAEAIVSSLKIK